LSIPLYIDTLGHIYYQLAMSATPNTERTEVLSGDQYVMNAVLHFLSFADRIDSCGDYKAPSLIIGVEAYKKLLFDLKAKGIRLRYITDITKDNIHYCKELLRFAQQIRHLEGIKANFSVSETEYMASATLQEEQQPIPQVIYSNVKDLVEQQKYVFEALWNKACPADQRFREIEEGVTLGSTEVILGPSRIQELFIDLVKSAKQEILLILPTTNSFLREHKLGIIQLLKQVASISEYNVNVRILTPTNDAIEKILKNMTLATRTTAAAAAEEQKKENEKFGIRSIDLTTEFAVSTVTIAVADRQISLAIEKKDDTKENFIDAIGLATYSTSKPTVSSYVSIFENLWAQTELYRQVKESNRQIALANEQLKKTDEMQKEFINMASHELRTPTQAILSYSELLQKHPEKREEMIQAMSRNAARLQKLTDDILDVTRIESQTLRLKIEPLNLEELISNIVEDYRTQIEKNNDNVKLFYEPKTNDYNNIIVVEADRARLIQVISNLLSNALKFTKKLGGGGEIYITAEKEKREKNGNKAQEVVITIKDNGKGIDPEILPRLFTKFATKSETGTGLGLFICKRIIEVHGGRIWAWNNNNNDDDDDGIEQGAVFAFSLPLSKKQEQQPTLTSDKKTQE
jgi:two-component system, OmpR family, sensor histidine kinase VicK